MSPADLASQLNPRQLEAATDAGHALCILAGAGSGKTRVITCRIVDLVQRRGATPDQILAVTFTNKAAREMRERVEQQLPGAGRGLTVATFHSACARILREHGTRCGLSPAFTIYDEDESQRLVAQLLEARGSSRQEAKPIYRAIERARNAGQSANDMEVSDFDIPGRQARELIGPYENALRQADACDFAGLLLEVVRLLEAQGPEAKAICARYRHLLVDEYQDTNAVQARLVYALGGAAESVTVVGDDDQSIYAWRGASADNLMRFLQTFTEARTVRLEQNYRSTATILEAANAIIEKNPGRLEKRLFTEGVRGPPLRIVGCPDERSEAHLIADTLERHRRDGVRLDQQAVLYRTNAQSRPIEDVLRRRRLPYRIVGGVHFYSRREVKDLVAYLRLALNPRSDVDLLRILNVPGRGIGDTTRLRLVRVAGGQQRPVAELLRDETSLAGQGVKKAAARKLRGVAELLDDLAHEIRDLDADQAVRVVAMRSGLVEALEQETAAGGARGDEAAERLDNVGSLVSAAGDFVQEAREQGRAGDLVAFLEEAALATDTEAVDAGLDTSQGTITMMTLHAAKGLEFEAVVLAGLEEGLFPQGRDGGLEDPERLAEERRLCYVGITRAGRWLTLTHARSRRTFGEVRRNRRSHFLDDIPAQLVARGGASAARQSPRPTPDRHRPTTQRRGHAEFFDPPAPDSFSQLSEPDIEMDFDADFIDDLEPAAVTGEPVIGVRVHHATFGTGVVTALEGHGPRGRLVIRFADSVKRVVARYVTVVEGPGP